MKVLEVPKHYNRMSVGVSMKGVTILNEAAYRQRHKGADDILQQPTTGLITKKNYFKTHQHELPGKKKKRKKTEASEITEKKVDTIKSFKPAREYQIDKKKVSHRILGFANKMKGEKLLYFWTVSFPIKTTDDEGYRLLNIWLTRMRSELHLKNYLWIAERQKNSTVHYHICINQRLDVRKANRFMRSAIMTSINSRSINWTREAAKNYNGVDISKNRKTKRTINFAKQKNQKALSNYLTKYVSKSNEKFTHLAWHNSRGYSNLVIQVCLTAPEYFGSSLRLQVDVDNPLIGEYFTFFRWVGTPPADLCSYLAMINQLIDDLTYTA